MENEITEETIESAQAGASKRLFVDADSFLSFAKYLQAKVVGISPSDIAALFCNSKNRSSAVEIAVLKKELWRGKTQ